MSKAKNYPFVSVIVPVYNDPEGLKDTVNSLVVQEFPHENFEIIVVDNGSKDNTLRVENEFRENYPELIRVLIEDEIQSSYAARNKGIRNSRGSIIAFIDADMTVEKDWLSKIFKSMEEKELDCLVCRVEIYAENKNIFSFYNQMTDLQIEQYVTKYHLLPTGCSIIYKHIFDEVGLFDSRLISSGDLEFGNRVYESGYELCYEPNIVIKHPARDSFIGLFKKYYRIGRGFYQLSYYSPDDYKRLQRNIFDPKYYIPYKPWKFEELMQSNYDWWKSKSLRIKLGFYFCRWLNAIALHVGYIYEILRMKRNKVTMDIGKIN